MNAQYFDAHCHVQFDAFNPDRDALIARMKEEGVAGVVVGCDLVSSKKAVELAEKHEHLWASIGLHPNREKDERYDISYYRPLAKRKREVAVGEGGLDWNLERGEGEASESAGRHTFLRGRSAGDARVCCARLHHLIHRSHHLRTRL